MATLAIFLTFTKPSLEARNQWFLRTFNSQNSNNNPNGISVANTPFLTSLIFVFLLLQNSKKNWVFYQYAAEVEAVVLVMVPFVP